MPPKILQIAIQKKFKSRLVECVLYHAQSGEKFYADAIIDRDNTGAPLNFDSQFDEDTTVVNLQKSCMPVVPKVGDDVHFDDAVFRITEISDNNQIETALRVVEMVSDHHHG